MRRLTLESNAVNQVDLSRVLTKPNKERLISEMRKSKVLNDLLFLDSAYLKESKDIKILNEEISTAMADLAVEENLPAEKEKVARNHLVTLVQAGVPALAAYRVIKNLIKGDFLEAIKNLPGVNILLMPEAIYELALSGLSALPDNIKADIMEHKEVEALLRLLYSIKELQKSEDLGAFYDNLKALVSESSRALIVFAGFLAKLAVACQGIVFVLQGPLLAAAAAIFGGSGGIAAPVAGAFLAVAGFLESVCVFLMGAAAGSGGLGAAGSFVNFLINKVSKMDPDAELFRDEKFRKEVANLVQGLSEEHAEKLKEKEDEMKVAFDQAEPLELDDVEDKKEDLLSDPITVPYEPDAPTPEEDLKLVAENKTYKRWQVLSGIN